MDLDRGRRDGTLQDMQDFLRLCQSLNVIQQESGGPLEPMDLPAATRHLDLYLSQITLLDKSWNLNALGGDEFVAVLLDLPDLSTAGIVLDRFLRAIHQPTSAGNAIVQLSASIGVTFYPQGAEIDADQLLRQADQAMYQAKVQGKNQVVRAD